MKKINWTDLVIFIVSAELTGAVSALISGNFSGFYKEIEKPPLSPPAFIFPFVWAILYALMGISAYMIYNTEKNSGRTLALRLYIAQLAVNFSWSIIFFRFRLLGAAAAVAVLLFLAVTAMALSFYRIKPSAAFINIPYILWSLFASYLAIGTAVLN